MKTELSEQFLRILFFFGGSLFSFLLLMNADAVVNFSDGALSEWNGYIVAAHLLMVCGCGIALLISRRSSAGKADGLTPSADIAPPPSETGTGSRFLGRWSESMALSAVLLAPLVVNLLWRFAASSLHLEQSTLGPLAFSVIALASLPIIALTTAIVILQKRLHQSLQQDDPLTSKDPTYLTSVTVGGALIGLAFYTLLVQPDAYLADMLHFAWVSYVVLFMLPAILLAGWSGGTARSPSTDGGATGAGVAGAQRADLSPAEFSAGARRIMLLGAVPSFLLIAVEPNVMAALPSIAHAYVLPLAVAMFALAVAFAHPPRVLQTILAAGVAWLSAIGLLIFAFSIYINRYALAVCTVELLSVFWISCSSYVRLAGERLRIGRICAFYLLASAGAFIGAALAELGNIAFDRWIFPLSLAVVLLGCLYRRIKAARNLVSG